jgi:enoyl-CoA hydratase/carnithine racemase
MIAELRELFVRVERDEGPAVLIFESADPDYFLAHFDISPANLTELASLPPGSTGLHPWLDILVRLSMLPAVTISAIRGRARGAGSEFALASDMRFASRERAVLAQIEVGFGAVPGGGPASWLPRLVGRGRAFEILFGGEDFNGELAERYRYVNRAIPDGEFESFVHRLARRVSTFDREAPADIKCFVNNSSTRCLYRTRRSFRPSWMHSCGRRRVPGYRREPGKPSIRDFRRARMSNFVSRSILERSPKQSLFPANKAVVRESVGKHGERITMGAAGRRARFGRMATNRLPALPTCNRNPTC